jgi:ABC-type transporter MlaC component
MNIAIALSLLLVGQSAFAEGPVAAAKEMAAAAKGPKEVVQEIFAKAAEPEVATDKAKQAEVNAYVDFDTLAKDASGKVGAAQPAAEQEWFRNTLREIITLTVYPKAPEFLKGVKINYGKVNEGETAIVESSVQNKADVTEVAYKLKKGNIAWKVTDVSIAGLSWVESIRDQVASTVKKKKWAGLKSAMNKRLATLKSGK